MIPKISFEFFPPKNEVGRASLWDTITRLAPLKPRFVSVTYGAGGSMRTNTHETIARIIKETDLEPAAHLTCIVSEPDELIAIAEKYWEMGVRHIVALRGDLPANGSATRSSLRYAADLVRLLRKVADFDISVAGYPESHPEARSADEDIDYLKRKIDEGASRVITQYFFETVTYERFLERVRKAGIVVPVVPGILPVTNCVQVLKFSAACGTNVPSWMVEMFDGLDDDPETRQLVAITIAAEQIQELLKLGVDMFHFYTLNRPELVYALCHRIGVRPPKGIPA